ncbi:hypothetical protein F511_25594 [Dorcoceras hygrometricum]|uniref:Uncharacterized protein n=1 Tax=Dorcoceras hygrometricum TaxID=472368 RepID=A0A2Z7CWE9_9LAMI|nr:hypothetical protein F511_25594 [Dorcoceras hygrometricum]
MFKNLELLQLRISSAKFLIAHFKPAAAMFLRKTGTNTIFVSQENRFELRSSDLSVAGCIVRSLISPVLVILLSFCSVLEFPFDFEDKILFQWGKNVCWSIRIRPPARQRKNNRKGRETINTNSSKFPTTFIGCLSGLPCWHLCLAPTGITRIRLFSVDCGSLRQSGPRPDPRLLRQATLEALTRSARTDSPRRVGRKPIFRRRRRRRKAAAAQGV